MSDTKPMHTEAAAVAEIVRDAPVLLALHDGERDAGVLIYREGFVTESTKPYLDEQRAAPERRKGVAQLADLGSFIAYMKRFADADSAIFANTDPSAPELVGVIDYHRTGYDGMPRFGEHRGVYKFPIDPSWKKWVDQNEAWKSQVDFAAFLEDRIVDVADPTNPGARAAALSKLIGCEFASPSRLLELSRGLSVRVGQKVAQHANLGSGEGSIIFETTHHDSNGSPLKIPGGFLIGLPVFRNGAAYQVPARLRYRVSGGAVTWSYALHGVDQIVKHALDEACDAAHKATGLPLFEGTPER